MTINQTIVHRLKEIEQQHSVVILFAVESGSRAWGFESVDSDYDIRFVYKHQIDWYLSIQDRRDVIEHPLEDNLDFSGWDVQKALKLFHKSNPPLLEWIKSPIIYLEQGTFRKDLLELQSKYFSPESSILHYIHMARGNFREYLEGETVKAKKYFYVLRPLFACDWILSRTTPPPMEFDILLKEVVQDPELTSQVSELLFRKRHGAEMDEGPSIPVIRNYVESRLSFYEDRLSNFKPKRVNPDQLEALFRQTLGAPRFTSLDAN